MNPQPESFFWAGLLTALVPMIILGGLGVLAVHLYLKERRNPTADRNDAAGPPETGPPEREAPETGARQDRP